MIQNNDTPLRGKVAIVTGASSGIGRAISLRLAEAGVACALAARRKEALEELAQEIEKIGGQALVVPTDVTDAHELEALVQTVTKELGGLQILVNNAGIYFHAKVEELKRSELESTLAVNLIAPIMLTKLALPHLKKSGESAIINMASIAATAGFARGSSYCASKFGMLGFSESLFEEVREDGIKVCAICPGYVATEMVAGYGLNAEKMIQTEDIASTVLHVLELPPTACPTRIVIRPQFPPLRRLVLVCSGWQTSCCLDRLLAQARQCDGLTGPAANFRIDWNRL